MPEPTPEAWAQIRHDYEHTDKPLAHICADHDITIPMMRYRMKRWEWTRRKPLIPREGPPPVAVVLAPPERALFSPLPLPSSGGGGSANAEGMSRGGVSFLRETFTPPRSQDARDPPPPGEGAESKQARPGWEGEETAIVPRLQSAVARVLPAIEATIARLAAGPHQPRDMEQAGRTLGSLTRTLRELNGLLSEHNARPNDARCECREMSPEDIDAFRIDLARRIDAFVASRTNPDGTIQDMSWGAK
jgi:hypothetical protein